MAIISEVQQQDALPETQSTHTQTTNSDAEGGHGVPKPFTGHTAGIYAITYSPDSKFVATGSRDEAIRIWGINSGMQLDGTMHGHINTLNTISYSSDGKSLASGSNDGTVRVWDTADPGNAPGLILEHTEGQIWLAVAFSPVGQLIAGGGSGGELKIWNADERKLMAEYKGDLGWIWSVAWEPSGKRLAAACDGGKVRVFDLTKPDVPVLLIQGYRGTIIRSIMYSPDGKVLASGADDHSVRLWDAQTGKPMKSPFRGHKDFVMSVAWSPDNTRIISGSDDHTVRVWDASNGRPLFKGPLYAHDSVVRSVSYSPDGKSFASADNNSPPRIQIWDAKTGKPSLPLLSDEEDIAFRKSIEPRLENYSIRSKPRIMRAGAAVLSIVWFPDGRRFATAGEESVIRIWSAQTGLQVDEGVGHRETVNALSISADGTKLASASDDHTILLFDTASMLSLTEPLAGHDGAVYAVKLTPDGSRVISGGRDKTVRFWDALTGKVRHVIEAHDGAVRALSVTEDGSKLASGADDNAIYVWDMVTYDRLTGPFRHDGSVQTMSFSPDGSRLISGSDDFTVRVWNVANGSLAFDPIHVHTGPVGVVDWSPDGTKLLTAGAHDWTIWIWDASTGDPVLGPLDAADWGRIGRDNGVRAAAFSRDGKRFVCGAMTHKLRMWDTGTGMVQTYEEIESDAVQSEARKRDDARRQPSVDDSIMNMPATIGRTKPQASTSHGFWDDTDLDSPSRRPETVERNKKNKKSADKSWYQTNLLRRIWQRRADPQEHAMSRMPRPSATKVSSAHDKLRVLAAGDDPRARFPWAQAEPESDDERGSPIGSADPSPADAYSMSDDESEHGLVDTICFCLCLPCCK